MAIENLTPAVATQARLAFVVKWVASAIQIAGYAATGFGWTPANLYLFLVGVLGWFAVGVLWKDRAIMLVHLVALAAMVAGMLGR
ncbi:DUF6552 family protein [Pseudooceanicola aestuarii]|uniref:DUF6552 family protein n=1 Tax=Pseudooceanicola aestuarii TaxID=2697319 RepID=UPI0013D44FDD|nr:DUF6552 family protein [Pseudooceanicola aestuarii]